jgi:hypothetical protein
MKRLFRMSSLLCLSLAACNSAKLSAVNGLAFAALAGVVPPPAENVQVIAKVTNTTFSTLQVSYAGCAVIPIFHSGSPNGPVVFDPRPVSNCDPTPIVKSLDPGDAVQITGSAVTNLAAGTYFVSAIINVNGTSRTVAAGSVVF